MNTQTTPPVLHMKCRNSDCDSIQVSELPASPTTKRYYCIKCNYNWTAPVGGTFTMKGLG